jgi:superoxide dismutase, Fe-Mn family
MILNIDIDYQYCFMYLILENTRLEGGLIMKYELPKLNYGYGDLEPFIDEETMKIHHTKHHQAYIDNLNKALEQHPELQETPLVELLKDLNTVPEDIRNAVRNNGGGHYNHSMFWLTMGPNKGGLPSSGLLTKIETTFGSFEKFKEEFGKAALTRFGSGWAWLVLDQSNNLSIVSTPNQDNPISDNLRPLLGLDVWEHAYYLKYQNKRADYITTWWNTVDWNAVESMMD